MKIAFCFLTNKNINNVNLWKQFFINNNNNNIYIHSKITYQIIIILKGFL